MDSAKRADVLYATGDCPVCFSSNSVLLLKAHPSGRLFFFCPFCGIGWPEPPPPGRIDAIQPLADFAERIALPAREEVTTAGLPSLVEVRLEDWYSLLEEHLLR